MFTLLCPVAGFLIPNGHLMFMDLTNVHSVVLVVWRQLIGNALLTFLFLSTDKHRLGDGDRDVVRFGLALTYWPVAQWGVVPAWGIGQPTCFSFLRLMSGSTNLLFIFEANVWVIQHLPEPTNGD